MIDAGERLPIKYLVLLPGALAVHILLFMAITGQKPGEAGIVTSQAENHWETVLFLKCDLFEELDYEISSCSIAKNTAAARLEMPILS